ncbi:MAG: hypothetical protein U5K29_02200 [Acidimicrobiales bacterium]|nr:hypothetical protein [Acidimicrobiales bacterium]
MNASGLDPELARVRAEARLGRPVQDPLELAVVLEAWSGVRPRVALDAGDQVSYRRHDVGPVVGVPRRRDRMHRHIASIVLAALTIGWIQPLESVVGSDRLTATARIVLPFSLGIVALLHRRYLVAHHGVAVMRNDIASVALIVAVAAVVTGVLAGGLIGGGLLIALVGLGLMVEALPVATIAAVGGSLSAVGLGADAAYPAVGVLLAVAGLAAMSLHHAVPSARPALPWRIVIVPALAMAAFGTLVLLATRSTEHLGTESLIVAVLPTLVALSAATIQLDLIWTRVPILLGGEALSDGPTLRGRQFVARLLVVTFLTYLGVVAILILAASTMVPAVVPVTVAMVGLVGLVAVVAEATGHPGTGLAVTGAGVLVCAVGFVWVAPLLAVAGGLVACAGFVEDPDQMFAVRW